MINNSRRFGRDAPPGVAAACPARRGGR